jgi:hypothetical protein
MGANRVAIPDGSLWGRRTDTWRCDRSPNLPRLVARGRSRDPTAGTAPLPRAVRSLHARRPRSHVPATVPRDGRGRRHAVCPRSHARGTKETAGVVSALCGQRRDQTAATASKPPGATPTVWWSDGGNERSDRHRKPSSSSVGDHRVQETVSHTPLRLAPVFGPSVSGQRLTSVLSESGCIVISVCIDDMDHGLIDSRTGPLRGEP